MILSTPFSKHRLSGYQEIRVEEIGVEEIRRTEDQVISKSGHQEKFIAGFEKLWVWQRAFKLMQEIHKFCKTLPRDERFRLRDQIERCSASVCDNIAEGYTAYYYKEKIRGFTIARKEAGETQNHIRKLQGKNYLNQEGSQQWIKEYEEVIRGINGFIRYITQKKGAKR